MAYRELLKKLAKFGYGQVSRMTRESYDMVSIGKPSEVVFPIRWPPLYGTTY
jgi:hypothetical protein